MQRVLGKSNNCWGLPQSKIKAYLWLAFEEKLLTSTFLFAFNMNVFWKEISFWNDECKHIYVLLDIHSFGFICLRMIVKTDNSFFLRSLSLGLEICRSRMKSKETTSCTFSYVRKILLVLQTFSACDCNTTFKKASFVHTFFKIILF